MAAVQKWQSENKKELRDLSGREPILMIRGSRRSLKRPLNVTRGISSSRSSRSSRFDAMRRAAPVVAAKTRRKVCSPDNAGPIAAAGIGAGPGGCRIVLRIGGTADATARWRLGDGHEVPDPWGIRLEVVA